MNKYKADVVIVGGGIAGIIAAFELLDSGKKIMIIDRDTKENFGGLAKWAFGGMFFVNSKHQQKAGIKDSIDLAIQDWFATASYDESEHWGKLWAEQFIHLCTPHGYNWMRKLGFDFFPVLNWAERGLFTPGNSVPRFHMVWGTGWALTYEMIAHLQAHRKIENLDLYFDHRVTDIIVENNVIKGVRGHTEDFKMPFEATGEIVIVASGGINGSIQRVKENWYQPWGTPPETILNGAHHFAVGDLHDATGKINGHVVNLEKQWNYAAGIHHYAPRYPNHGLSLIPPKSALWLNYEGKRFGPMPLIASYDTSFLVETICKEPVKYSWQLLNYNIAKKELAISGSEHNVLIRDKKFLKFIIQTLFTGNSKMIDGLIDKCKDIVVANTVEELVEKMNALTGDQHVQLDYVKEAIRQYNSQVERGTAYFNDEQFRRIVHLKQYRGDRARTAKFQKIDNKKSLPLIAIREFILSRKSMGGIQTDLNGNVLTQPDANGHQTPIEGLYAIGEAAGFGGGGIHGKRSLEGTFLGGCLITARVASAHILGKSLN